MEHDIMISIKMILYFIYIYIDIDNLVNLF